MNDSDRKIAIKNYVSALTLVDMIKSKIGEITATGVVHSPGSEDDELQIASVKLAKSIAEAGIIAANAAIKYQAQAARYTEGDSYQHICESLSLIVEAKLAFEAIIELSGKALH